MISWLNLGFNFFTNFFGDAFAPLGNAFAPPGARLRHRPDCITCWYTYLRPALLKGLLLYPYFGLVVIRWLVLVWTLTLCMSSQLPIDVVDVEATDVL